MGGGQLIKSRRRGFHTADAGPPIICRTPQSVRRLNLSATKKSTNMIELTPNERQAAMIADLEARLQLAEEKLFYTASQNAKLRTILQSTSLIVNTILDESPYLPETTKN